MDAAEYTIIGLNAALGLGLAWPLAGFFARLEGMPHRRPATYGLLVVVYVLECVAFSASMGTDIWSVALAFVWGGILGSWLRRRGLAGARARKAAVLFASYSSLPAASFLVVPLMAAFAGWSVVTVDAGRRFGIPSFVPWPANTILGFSIVVATLAVVLKLVITPAIVSRRTNV